MKRGRTISIACLSVASFAAVTVTSLHCLRRPPDAVVWTRLGREQTVSALFIVKRGESGDL